MRDCFPSFLLRGTVNAKIKVFVCCALALQATSSSCTSLLLPPSSPEAVKQGPCLLTPRKGSSSAKPVPGKTYLHFLLGARDRRLGAEHYQLPCGFTGTSSGSCKETEVARFGHVTRHDSLSETIFQGTLEGGRRRGRQRKCWMDNSKEWTSLPMPELHYKGHLQQRLEEDLC